MDHFLQPLVKKYLPTPSKDSRDIIQLLESKSFPKDCILTTIDVSGLYPSIPHDEGIKSTLHHLYEVNPYSDDIPFPPEAATAILETILKENCFEFNSKIYKQVRGTAMGTKMAPSYANLFMADLEQESLEKMSKKPLIYREDSSTTSWPSGMRWRRK